MALEEVSIVAALGCKEVNLAPAYTATPIIGDNTAVVNKASRLACPWHCQAVKFSYIE